jgi:hypothetical protein
MLAYLRGEAPPPVECQYSDRFVDTNAGKEVGSASGRSLIQLVGDAGLNPNSVHDRNRVQKILKSHGFDYDSGQGWSAASYLREHKVLEGEAYEQALRNCL